MAYTGKYESLWNDPNKGNDKGSIYRMEFFYFFLIKVFVTNKKKKRLEFFSFECWIEFYFSLKKVGYGAIFAIPEDAERAVKLKVLQETNAWTAGMKVTSMNTPKSAKVGKQNHIRLLA